MNESVSSKKQSTKMFFDKIIYGILVAITFLVPIFFVPVSFISIQFGTSLLFGFGVIICLLLFIVSVLISGSVDIPKPAKYFVTAVSAVPVAYVLAGVANGFSRLSFLGYTFDQGTVGFILIAFAYLFLVSMHFRKANRIFYGYLAIVFSSLFVAAFLVIRLIFGSSVMSFGIFNNLTSSIIGTWNNVGIFFGMLGIFSLLTHEMILLGKKTRAVLWASMLLSLFFLATVGFNVIWVVLAICSGFFVLYKMFSSDGNSYGMPLSALSFKQKLSRISLLSVIVFAVSLYMSIFGATLSNKLSAKINVSNVEVRPTMAVTLDIAKNTLISRPLFGSGPNTFVTQWLSFKPDDVTSTIFWNTDFTNGIGMIPTFAVTTGIIGILSWLIFFAIYVYLGLRFIFSKIDDRFLKYTLVSSFFISLFLWMMTFVYVPSAVIFILTIFFTGIFFASICASGSVQVTPKVFSYSPITGFVVSLIMTSCFVGFVFLGYGLFRNSQALWYFQKSSYALNSAQNIDDAENYMNKTIATAPYDIFYRALSEIEIFKMNSIIRQDPKKVGTEIIQKQFSTALETGIKAGLAARDADPTNYLNWIALARVYESVADPSLKITGAYESGLFAYNEALKRNPKNPGILVLLSRMAINHGDLAGAESYATQAISIKQNYSDAYFLLAQIQVAKKDIKSAIQSVTATTIIDPTNAGSFFQLGLLKFNVADYPGAIEALNKAISLMPDYANAQYYLGLAYEIVGEHLKAIALFETLAKTNPDSKEVATILTTLKSGKSLFAPSTEPTAVPSKKATKPPITEKSQ